MQINFTGQNIEITQALKTVATEKLQKLEKRFTHISNINIIFRVEGVFQITDATVIVNKTTLHASAKADDMYKAIDELVDKLATQMTKHKEKLTNHR